MASRPTEQTPLLGNRASGYALRPVLIGVILLVLLYTTILPLIRHVPSATPARISYDEVKHLILTTPSGEKARQWTRYYTSGPHLAGRNYSQVEWTRQKWEEFGLATQVVAYDCYLNYPRTQGLAILKDGSVNFEANLDEDALAEDPTTQLKDRVPVFHGYAALGDVTASYVYVNYGTYRDYADLLEANVTLKGRIAVARYGGGNFRGMKIQRAQELGMVGVVIYSDPGEDGEHAPDNGYEVYPEGPARHPSSVQRGGVQYLSFVSGDPTTPGYASKAGVPRQPVDSVLPSIPSVPLSYRDVIPILASLNGFGPQAADLGDAWNKNLGLYGSGVRYNVGPSPRGLQLHLLSDQEYSIKPIHNVLGIINGTSTDEVIIIGGHRDAWVAGGAVDPHSGTSAILEVIRTLGLAISKGWKPDRTIVFASWDGEEYSLLGSTEWVEEYMPWLQTSAVAYVNVDIGVSGKTVWSKSNPLFYSLFERVIREVPLPDRDGSVHDTWDGSTELLASGSDFTAFQDYAGIPSIDIGFGDSPNKVDARFDAVYHYHSNYDSLYYMENFIDPGFAYHATLAKVLGLLVLELATRPTIPYNASGYAAALDEYVRAIPGSSEMASQGEHEFSQALRRLEKAVVEFQRAARAHDELATKISRKLESRDAFSTARWTSRTKLLRRLGRVNDRYKTLDRRFLHEDGLDGRPLFKHVIYAPGLWTGYTSPPFPGIRESIDSGNWTRARQWTEIIESKVLAAAASLR